MVPVWKHQCTETGKEEVNYISEDCPHCGAKSPEPETLTPPPAPPQTA